MDSVLCHKHTMTCIFRIFILLVVFVPICVAKNSQELSGPFPAEILNVVDGDTFTARVNIWLGQSIIVNVRLNHIDTPEIRGQCATEIALAKKARQFSQDWLMSGRILLENVHYGKYAHRVLATVKKEDMDDISLSTALLDAGLAKIYDKKRVMWCG